MANLLQDQFKSVYSNPSDSHVKSPVFSPPSCVLDSINFDVSSISKAIHEIGDSSPGEDGFPSVLLKRCNDALSYPIFLIWKESFASGTIPDYLKNQLITPVFKKGSKFQPVNYRPIALTSNIIKIFERVIRSQLVEYLETNQLITNNQYGFRKGRSCVSELLAHYEDILSNINSRNAGTDVIYLDFSKAFDKVDHKLLLEKLTRYGIQGQLYDWIACFLSGRTQTVIVEGFKSYPILVISGVPQGTVLGPILFLLFINDIEQCLTHSQIRCFADDSRLIKSVESPSDALLLQQDLDNVMVWADENNMSLNQDKFELIQHHPSSRNYLALRELPFVIYENSYFASDVMINPTDLITDLGVKVQQDLSFSAHIYDSVKKARNRLSWVLSVFRSRSILTIKTLFASMVRPLLEYSCVVWNPSKVSEISLIEGVQRTATAKIDSIKHLNYWDRLSHLKLMSLQRRRERYILMYMYKILHNYVPNDNYIVFYESPRLGLKARVPPLPLYRAKLTLYDSSFSVRGPLLWNILPKSINCLPTFNEFKHELDRFILRFPDHPPVNGYSTFNSNSLTCWA